MVPESRLRLIHTSDVHLGDSAGHPRSEQTPLTPTRGANPLSISLAKWPHAPHSDSENSFAIPREYV